MTRNQLEGKQFCAKCEYYYSEMFTCPICYGERKAEERIIKLLEGFDPRTSIGDLLPLLIKGENK